MCAHRLQHDQDGTMATATGANQSPLRQPTQDATIPRRAASFGAGMCSLFSVQPLDGPGLIFSEPHLSPAVAVALPGTVCTEGDSGELFLQNAAVSIISCQQQEEHEELAMLLAGQSIWRISLHPPAGVLLVQITSEALGKGKRTF